MTNQDFHPVERIVRYGVSGILVSLIFSLSVIAFVHIFPRIGPVGASVVAFCVVQPIGYLIHRAFTFPDSYLATARTGTSMGRFIFTNLGSVAIAAAGMAVVTNLLHKSYLWGIALNWVLIPCTNFLFYRFWVFEIRSSRGRDSA